MKRANLGCGAVWPEGWDNIDRDTHGQEFLLDILQPGHGQRWADDERFAAVPAGTFADYDYIVANHLLSDIGHHQLVEALSNIRGMLKPGGVLRILVPDILRAVEALMVEEEGWFPQDERTGDIDAKFCTFVTWFGESKSVFTYGYLLELLRLAGFSDVSLPLDCGETKFGDSGIVELDDRCREALIVEAMR